jgi:PAS domain S-box-containing protein
MVDSNIFQNPINVLLVEDDAASRQLVRRALKSHDPAISYDIAEADDLATAKKMLVKRKFDNVILDLHLPDSSGLDTLRSIKDTDPDVPIVVLSAISAHETAVNSIKHGADYYIVKGEMLRELLGRSVCFSIERKRRQLDSGNQDKLQSHVDLLHYQIREIKESLSDQISSKNHAEWSIQRLAAEHENLLDILPAMIWHLDNNGKIIRLNKHAADMINKETEELVGKDFYRFFAGDDEHARNQHETVCKEGVQSNEVMEPYKSRTGSLKYLLTEVVPHRDESGNICGLVIMAKNPASKDRTVKKVTPNRLSKSRIEKFSTESSFMIRQAGAVRVEKTDKPQKQFCGKILVVDHDSLNRMLIGTHLRGSGVDVEFAVSGSDAIEKSRSCDFDLVLTALLMPKMDGLDVIDNLRQNDFHAPIVVMTADYSPNTIQKIKLSGSADHIFKPINKKDIFAVIDKHLTVPAL